MEVRDHRENVPLHVAAQRGNYECVELLVQAGADMGSKNEDEQTPMHLAAIEGREEVIKYFLKR